MDKISNGSKPGQKFHTIVFTLFTLNFSLIYVGYDCLEEIMHENFDFDQYAKLLGIVILTYLLLFILKKINPKSVNNPNRNKINSGLALLALLYFTLANLNLIHNVPNEHLRDKACDKAGNFDLFSSGSTADSLTIEEYNEIRYELPLPKIPLNSQIISYWYRHTDDFFDKIWFEVTYYVPNNFAVPGVNPNFEQQITKQDSIQVVKITKPY